MMASTRHPKSYEREPADIEREIAETRQAIDSTVGELGQRLAPSQLMDDARNYVKETAVRGVNSMWTRMSDNAVPLGLIGSGVVWMMASRRSHQGEAYSSGYSSGYSSEQGYRFYDEQTPSLRERAGEAAASGAERARELAASSAERAREVGHGLRERGAELGESAQQQMHRARQGFDTMRAEQPLLLGIAALACGALLGGLIPTTRREDRLVGEVRDQVVGAARELGAEKVQEVREAAERTLREGSDAQGSEAQSKQRSASFSGAPITPQGPGI
jgi:hypothetical protein